MTWPTSARSAPRLPDAMTQARPGILIVDADPVLAELLAEWLGSWSTRAAVPPNTIEGRIFDAAG